MHVLAVNSGSSSMKCALIDSVTQERVADWRIENIGTPHACLTVGEKSAPANVRNFDDALALLTRELPRWIEGQRVDAVAHRIVHGGTRFRQPTLIDDTVLTAIAALNDLAPLHNPPALQVVRALQSLLKKPHVAIFDTAFHATLPPRAREYALPRELTRQKEIRRYGFHGINHAHVMHATASYLKTEPAALRIVSLHLGNGASICAIEYGRSVETSMGMTPLEGLVMGSRAGDLDPGIIISLLRFNAFDVESLDRLLNKESGLVGLTGTNDMAAIEQRAGQGDEDCRRAITLYAHRARKYIGAYAAVMGGVDVIAFTGGVGEHSALLRHRIAQRFDFLGAILDEDRNRDAAVSLASPLTAIAADTSRVQLLVIKADEETQMAAEVMALLGSSIGQSAFHVQSSSRPDSQSNIIAQIPVAISARHAHLSVPTIEALFGKGYELTRRSDLSQVGQFAARETVTLIGPKGRLENVRVMGPPRKDDQVEISRSDEFVLGVDAPVRISGDLANTPGITIEGPNGRITIPRGVICARRHIHMSTDEAKRFGVKDSESVQVKIDSEGRDVIFADVTVRVAPDYRLELHLDTDEANAAGVVPHQSAELLQSSNANASIITRNLTGTR